MAEVEIFKAQERERLRREREGNNGNNVVSCVYVVPANGGAAATIEGSPPQLNEVAFHGVAGDIVRTLRPHTESDPVALLLQTLTLAGNAIGPHPYYAVEGDRHHANLFTVMVGATSKARKGTSGGRVRSILKVADEVWNTGRVRSGLSSGEGLINEVRDEVQRWDSKANAFEIVDPGVTDKRLMIFESEFASALRVCERHGNTLSPVLRNAWDSHTLQTITKNSPLKATNPHISIVGHITTDELRSAISRTDLANGLANRFLFATVKRSQFLPFGGDLSDSQILEMGNDLRRAIETARTFGRLTMTDAARAAWKEVYKTLSADKAGLLGAVTARAEAQVIRLALIYALLDKQPEMDRPQIDKPHLKAALEVWEYCEVSVANIFGDILGDPIADEILIALRQAQNGMSRTDIRNIFGRNQSSDRVGAALRLLASKGRARSVVTKTGERGRPTETWFANTATT